MFNQSGLVGVGIFVVFYLALVWAGFRWAVSRVNRRARSVLVALERAGAHRLEMRPTVRVGKPAEIEFEFSGRKARVEVRQWGRDGHLVSVHIDSRPMPALWIRRERAVDRMAKAIGLEHEVQIGDAAFDAAAYISSRAPDAVVRDVLATEDVRRVVIDILQRGYSVVMSQEGLRAATLTWSLVEFDGASLAPILGLLEKLSAALPPTDASLAAPFQTPRSPAVVILPVMLGCMVVMGVLIGAGRDLVHPPMESGNVALALFCGLVLWLPAVYLAARLLRGRPLAIFELVFVAIALLAAVPFAGGFALFAVNSGLDWGAPTHHRAHVLGYYKHNSHTVWVESWVAGTDREKLIVPWSIPVVSVGDTLEFDTHPGALGWTWISDIRRGQ